MSDMGQKQFADAITSHFDITMCQCAMLEPSDVPDIYTSGHARSDIMCRAFHCNIERMRDVSETHKRSQKC